MASISEPLRLLLDSVRHPKRLSRSREDDDDSGDNAEDKQELMCMNLLQSLAAHCKQRIGRSGDHQRDDTDVEVDTEVNTQTELNTNNFIHTRLDYNNKRKQASPHTDNSSRERYAPFSNTNVREVFCDRSNSISQLPPLLASLMMTRVEFEKLLPATQDAEANEAAMDSSALTLTKPALTAARLYATLLAIPGALGSGVIQMETVSSLAALFRGWRREAATAVDKLMETKKGSKKKQYSSKREPSAKRKAKSTTTYPIKRGKGRNRVHVVDAFLSSDDDDEQEDNSNMQLLLGEHDGIITAKELIVLGMEAGLALSQVLWQKEFLSWSTEAREAVVDAVTSVHSTAAALVTPSIRTRLSGDLIELQQKLIESTTLCLQQCILSDSCEEENDDDFGTSTKRHETTVFIFRGLYPVMAMREHLPNGAAGQQCAYEVATETLEGFIKAVAADTLKKYGTWKDNNLESSATHLSLPASLARSRWQSTRPDPPTTPMTTARKSRKKRVSFGSLNTAKKTPVLKSEKKRCTSGVTPRRSPDVGATPRPVLSAALGLMQKLTTLKGLERAGFRRSIATTLKSCLQYMPQLEQTHFLRFMNRLCSSKVSVHRLLVAELISATLAEPWLWEEQSQVSIIEAQSHQKSRATPQSSLSPSSLQYSSSSTKTKDKGCTIPMSLLESLIGRLDDRTPAVRACAASAFSQLFRQVAEVPQTAECIEGGRRSTIMGFRISLASKRYTIVNRLKQRALADDKAVVRRTAIYALSEVISLGIVEDKFPVEVGEEEASVFGQLCGDTSAAARKAAAQALTSLLQRCSPTVGEDGDTFDIVARTWTASVLPLALDSDATCVLKALDLVNQIVIQPIVAKNEDDLTGRCAASIAWKILSFVCESSWSGTACTAANALKVALGKLTTAEAGPRDLSKVLVQRVAFLAARTMDVPLDDIAPEIEWQIAGAWFLFETIVDQTSNLATLDEALRRQRLKLDFLGTSWPKMLQLLDTGDMTKSSESTWRCCLRSCLFLLARLSTCVSDDVAQLSASKLRELLHGFALPPDLIGSAVSALTATLVSSSDHEDVELARKEVEDIVSSLYRISEDSINTFAQELLQTGHSNLDAVEINVRAIFLVGELSTIGFCPDDDDTKEKRETKNDPLRGFYIPPSRKLVDLMLAFLPPPSKYVRTPKSTRAHAFLAVGKMCLRDEPLAKKCVKIMARELMNEVDVNECYSAKSNALVALGDLCVRYPSLVDKYLAVMARCLQAGVDANNTLNLTLSEHDMSAVVRKNAVILLSGLILQDYVKWRGLLFHRFLVASADSDDSVAEISADMLVGPLLKKSPKLFSINFVESLFVLNRCEHPIYVASKTHLIGGGGVGFDGINLSGPAGRAKRFQMYELMLSKMPDEDKIGVTARIARDVLGGALADGGVLHTVCSNGNTPTECDREHASAFNVLSDAFAILSSPLLLVGKGPDTSDDDQEDIVDPNTVPNPARRVVVAKGKLLSKISLKHLIEIVLPVLRNLKALLQKSCSPLTKDLMEYMVHIYRSYKREVKEVLSVDAALLREIEFEARKKMTPKRSMD